MHFSKIYNAVEKRIHDLSPKTEQKIELGVIFFASAALLVNSFVHQDYCGSNCILFNATASSLISLTTVALAGTFMEQPERKQYQLILPHLKDFKNLKKSYFPGLQDKDL